jgi:hypothetical protein
MRPEKTENRIRFRSSAALILAQHGQPEWRRPHTGELFCPMPAITAPRLSNDINEMIPSEMTQ